MPRRVTALFPTEAAAESAATRLAAIGIDRSKVRIGDQSQAAADAQKPGFFDHLTELLLAEGAAPPVKESRTGFLLTAEVEPHQVDQAASLLETGAITAGGGSRDIPEQLFEFTETAEELIVGKQTVIREEIVLHKEVEERVEQVEGTVRHTEAEVERIEPGSIEPEPIRFGGRTELLRGSGWKSGKK